MWSSWPHVYSRPVYILKECVRERVKEWVWASEFEYERNLPFCLEFVGCVCQPVRRFCVFQIKILFLQDFRFIVNEMTSSMNIFKFIGETEGLENSINFAIQHGLLPDSQPKDCMKCGKICTLKWTKNSRASKLPYMFVCSEKHCRATISARRNTMFDHLTCSLSSALRLIYFWLIKIAVQDCANQLEVSWPYSHVK